ncbi:MAG TPA: SDR family oxidoreductase [Candidatus Saccharimonadales bacterium]|jgi:dehydrogenase/reductase SDR family protein 7B|nr:SDR family oxidoreductase [Candidatus Saccharimonadales bacterium]
MPNTSFNTRRIWITGATSGIGEALAVAFHKAGAKLILSARREEELKRVQAACGGEASTRILPMDVSRADELTGKCREALGLFGGIDILVLNAGVSQRSLVKDTSMDVYRSIMETNYFGPIGMTRAVLPSMLENKSGHIVVISSVAGKLSTPLRSGYSASKHSLHGFYDSLRAEVAGQGIEVTLVCPGFIQTNVSVNAFKGDGSRHSKMDSAVAKGMTAERCAEEILKGVAGHKLEFYVGGRDKYIVYLKRFFPGVFARRIARMR